MSDWGLFWIGLGFAIGLGLLGSGIQDGLCEIKEGLEALSDALKGDDI